jgi:single-strand DNA-binding protein
MFQQTIVVGYVGSDPELRYTAAGKPVANFSVAVNERWKSQDGQLQERTTWFRVATWDKLAETCSQYVTKGKQVMVIGRVSAHAYIAADNAPKAMIDVTASTVRFLGPAGNGKAEPSPFADEAEEEPTF